LDFKDFQRPPCQLRFGLDDLTVVELAILISAKIVTLQDSQPNPTFNLATLYAEYLRHSSLVNKQGVFQRPFSRPVFSRAYEHLRSVELIIDAQSINKSNGQNLTFRKSRLLPWFAHLDGALRSRSDIPSHYLRWSTRHAA